MSRIVFDTNLLKVMSIFEALTGARLKDCILDNSRTVFVVEEGQISRAIGRNGSNIRRLESALNRKIKIVEFNPDIVQFINNLFYPAEIKDVVEQDKVYTIMPENLTARGFIIGKGAQNLRLCEAIAKRYFEVKEIRVK